MQAMGVVSISGYPAGMPARKPRKPASRNAKPREYPNRIHELVRANKTTYAEVGEQVGSHEVTIAKLANGIKRFKLPDEFNYIQLYQQITDDPKTGHGEDALTQLAQIYENRRQYKKAAAVWERSIKEYGPGNNNYKKQRLDQIVGNAIDGRLVNAERLVAGEILSGKLDNDAPVLCISHSATTFLMTRSEPRPKPLRFPPAASSGRWRPQLRRRSPVPASRFPRRAGSGRSP